MPQRGKWILLSLGACLLAVLYLPVLSGLVGQWLSDPNYRHGIVIPFVSAFLVWLRRDELKAQPGGGGAVRGVILIIVASALLIGGTAASELFTTRISLPVFLIGASSFLLGSAFTARLAFPLLFLFMMVPLPYIIYYKLTFPLQLLSARISAGILDLLQINVIRKGNIIHLPNYSLEVIAACSGLRSLMTMITLALIFAAFSNCSMTRKVLIVAWAVPAAIAANTIRLVVTAIGAYTVGGAFADGILHDISGLIVFFAGFLMLALFVWVMKWIK
jgi:exosortase